MSEDTLGAVEIQERTTAPKTTWNRKKGFSFLAGTVVLMALAAIGVKTQASKRPSISRYSDRVPVMTVTVVHPQKTSITIPVLPGRTQAYTDAPIFAQTMDKIKVPSSRTRLT